MSILFLARVVAVIAKIVDDCFAHPFTRWSRSGRRQPLSFFAPNSAKRQRQTRNLAYTGVGRRVIGFDNLLLLFHSIYVAAPALGKSHHQQDVLACCGRPNNALAWGVCAVPHLNA